eukprot:s357_g27.t1
MADCPMYFAKLWQEQIVWVEKQLKASQATWQVIVTHFPCGHQPAWYNRLHVEFGLDFLVTGHTHIQHTIQLGGLLCVISGGGGGILSESASHGDDSNSYGFYDATINRRVDRKSDRCSFHHHTWQTFNDAPGGGVHQFRGSLFGRVDDHSCCPRDCQAYNDNATSSVESQSSETQGSGATWSGQSASDAKKVHLVQIAAMSLGPTANVATFGARSVQSSSFLRGTALLEEHGVNFAGCLEKSELKELWECFLELCQQPLASLQAQVSQLAGPSGPRFPDVPSCARFLVAKRASRRAPEQANEAEALPTPPRPVAAPLRVAEVGSSRDREAQEEVLRILPLRREDFRSPADWGFAVLGLGAPQAPHNAAAVQRSYRNLMRKLHPDKVLATDGVERSIQLIREAKDICEKSFSRIEPPMAPQSLRYEVLDSKVGHRRYQLRWLPPAVQDAAPVCRYLVSALDPAYGKPLTITVLEPDYSEELRRFVTTEELTSFVLADDKTQCPAGRSEALMQFDGIGQSKARMESRTSFRPSARDAEPSLRTMSSASDSSTSTSEKLWKCSPTCGPHCCGRVPEALREENQVLHI